MLKAAEAITDNYSQLGLPTRQERIDWIFKIMLHEASKTPEPKWWRLEKDEELFGADPKCNHRIVHASGGGIKCLDCSGWYCL